MTRQFHNLRNLPLHNPTHKQSVLSLVLLLTVRSTFPQYSPHLLPLSERETSLARVWVDVRTGRARISKRISVGSIHIFVDEDKRVGTPNKSWIDSALMRESLDF
jgi:hypothetical protein